MKRVFVIQRNDLTKYPPTQSLINVLLDMGVEVIYVGLFSDKEGQKNFEQRGVKFVPIVYKNYDVSKFRIVNHLTLLAWQAKYKHLMRQFFKETEFGKDDLVWYIYDNSALFLYKYFEKIPYVIQFYEFVDYTFGWKYHLLYPHYNVKRFFSKARKLIHCEYTRAMITNGLFGIKNAPIVMPNKPYEETSGKMLEPKDDIMKIISEVKQKIEGKRVIIYQGVFNSYERRLDEFCEAMALLPNKYMLICMGAKNAYYEKVRQKYQGKNIIFLPFVKPPYHLQITKLAHIGVMTYFPAGNKYEQVINPLFCAPNKIFEYGKYSIPMIANDVPGLQMIFCQYNCGKIVSQPLTPQKVADCIISIENNYEQMSKGSKAYYDSVDLRDIIKNVIYE